MISCVMPTMHARRHFIPLAIKYFQRQIIAEATELVIFTDRGEDISDLIPPDIRIRYKRTTERLSIGNKYNAAIAECLGDRLAIWEDDDWHAPTRLAQQSQVL